MYDDIPDEIRRATREQRIRFYEKRVRRYLPAFELLESIDTGLEVDEIREELESVKEQINQIESTLYCAESDEFLELTRKLDQDILRIKDLMSQRRGVLLSGQADIQLALRNLTDSQEQAIGEAEETERLIVAQCAIKGIEPKPYLRLHMIVAGCRR